MSIHRINQTSSYDTGKYVMSENKYRDGCDELQILVIGYYNHFNLGDEQYKDTILYLLKRVFYKKHVLPEIIFIDCDKLMSYPVQSNTAVVLGGGDVLNHYFLDSLWEKFPEESRPLSLIALSVGVPYDDIFIQPEQRKKLEIFDHIFLRTLQDIVKLKKYITGKPMIHYLPDTSCFVTDCIQNSPSKFITGKLRTHYEHIQKMSKTRKIIGMMWCRHIYHPDSPYYENYVGVVKSFSTLIDTLIQQNYGIVMIPFNTKPTKKGDSDYGNKENDIIIQRDILKHVQPSSLPFICNIEQTLSTEQTLFFYKQFFVSVPMRFHATLFSVYSGVPMIPIYTTKKIRNFLLDIQWTYENVLEKNSKDLPTFFDKTAWLNTFKRLIDPMIYLDAKKQLLQITANFKQQSLHETPTIRKSMQAEIEATQEFRCHSAFAASQKPSLITTNLVGDIRSPDKFAKCGVQRNMDCPGKSEEDANQYNRRLEGFGRDVGNVVETSLLDRFYSAPNNSLLCEEIPSLDMGNLYPEKDTIEYGCGIRSIVPENSGRYESSGQRALLATTESRQAELAEDSREFLRHRAVGVATRNPRNLGFLDDDSAKLGIGRSMEDNNDISSLSKNQQILYKKLQHLAQEYGKDDFRALDNKESQQIAVHMVSHYLTNSLDSSYNHGLMKKMFSMDYPFISEWTWVENDVFMKNKNISIKSSVSFSQTFPVTKLPLKLVVEGILPFDQQSIETYPMRFNISYIDQNDRSGVHRSGWKFVYDHIQSFQDSSESAILLDLYVDRTFHWKRNIYRNIDVIPYMKPWIGFVHHTFNTDFSEYNNHNLLNTPEFLQSLPFCQGLIVLSKTLQQQFIEFLSQTKKLAIQPIPVYALRHPTDFDVPMFDYSMFLSNQDKKLLHIGGWMRNIFSFYQMDISSGFTEICTTPIKVEKKMDEIPKKKWCDCFSMFQKKPNKLPTDLIPEKPCQETMDVVTHILKDDFAKRGVLQNMTNYQLRKVILKGKNMNNYFPHEEWKEQIYHSLIVPNHTPSISSESSISISEMYCSSNHKIHNNWIKHMMEYLHKISKDIEIMEYVDNHNYDELLTKNIVFLNLVDGSAINTLLECLVRNTPIVVNRHPAVVEILGDDYPLFYDDVFMVGRILQEPEIIHKTHIYLSQLDKSSFHMDFFLTQLNKIITKTMKVT